MKTADGTDLSATATLNSITLSWTRESDVDSDGDATEVKPTGFVIDAIKGTGGTGDGQKFAFLGSADQYLLHHGDLPPPGLE